MIDLKKYGIEEGDVVRITIEGEVRKADLYDPWPFEVNGFGLGRAAVTEPAVEILQKAEPKWHSAQVIKASVLGYDPECLLRAETAKDTWLDAEGDLWAAAELSDVEIIVQ